MVVEEACQRVEHGVMVERHHERPGRSRLHRNHQIAFAPRVMVVATARHVLDGSVVGGEAEFVPEVTGIDDREADRFTAGDLDPVRIE